MDFNEFSNIISLLFYDKLNYSLSLEQIEKLYNFMNLLITESEKYNLTSITEPVDIIYKHFLDSCYIILNENFSFDNKQIVDIGCGAGFPSIPISILCPNNSFTLLDSTRKKIDFINLVSSSINLANVKAIHTRIEELSSLNHHRESYDFCLSRALSNTSVVLEYSSPFLKVNGKAFLYKMANSESEISSSNNAQNTLNLFFNDKQNYKLYENEPERRIYSFIKTNNVSNKFPRKNGLAAKKPL